MLRERAEHWHHDRYGTVRSRYDGCGKNGVPPTGRLWQLLISYASEDNMPGVALHLLVAQRLAHLGASGESLPFDAPGDIVVGWALVAATVAVVSAISGF